MTTVIEFLNEDRAKACAQEIMTAFEKQGSSETIEVDFNLSKGKMVEPLDQANTWFKFDCRDAGGALQEVFEFLTELWRDESTTEEDAERVREFERLVVSFIESMTNAETLGTILRQSVFKSVPAELLPIKEFRFHRVEFAGEDEQGYLLKVEKLAKVDPETGQYIDTPQTVAKELIQIHTETGKDFKDIIEEKRLAGDARYEFVADARLERYVRDVTVTLSADYSFCENPAHESTA
tara:strand:- start:2395 stop:3105 length:711 start_codon:yes stop_codon:yes gene_type:complete